MRTLRMFGVDVVDQPFEAALEHAGRLLDEPRPRALYFANAHTLNLASTDDGYRSVLNAADAVFGDGTGVRWAARFRGARLAANLCGTDLVPALLRSRPGLRCFVVGSTEGRIERIAANFRALFPGCVLVGSHHGYLDETASAALVDRINAAGTDILLVGMGNPLQERWIDRHRDRIEARLSIAVGGLLEYWAGSLTRAPLWMRRCGVEWVHILSRQRWKAKRYLIGNLQFLWRNLAWLQADLALRGTGRP